MKIFDKIKHNKTLNWVFSIFVVMLMAIIYALAITVFVSPSKLLAGGVSGMTLIIGRLFSTKTISETQIAGVLTFCINIPLLILAWRKLNLKFAILSSVHVITASTLIALLPSDIISRIFGKGVSFQQFESAFFAGAIVGASTGIAFSLGASSGGIDIVAYYLSSKKQLTVGKLSSVINASIIILSIILFPEDGINTAMYTLIYIFSGSIVLDAVFNKNKKNMIHIVTNKGDEVAKYIMTHFYRGVTRIDAKGAYTGNKKDFLYVIATSFESHEIISQIKTFDPDCFITLVPVFKVYGRFINKEIH